MEIEAMKKMGSYLWQERCYICAEKEDFICQEASVSELEGGWRIYLNNCRKARRNRKLNIDNCKIRCKILAVRKSSLN